VSSQPFVWVGWLIGALGALLDGVHPRFLDIGALSDMESGGIGWRRGGTGSFRAIVCGATACCARSRSSAWAVNGLNSPPPALNVNLNMSRSPPSGQRETRKGDTEVKECGIGASGQP